MLTVSAIIEDLLGESILSDIPKLRHIKSELHDIILVLLKSSNDKSANTIINKLMEAEKLIALSIHMLMPITQGDKNDK